MSPTEDSNTSRSRQRSNHACLTCRRKKTRCPGQKPSCSSCVRLGQPCSYPPDHHRRPSQGGRSDERLAHLEEKIDLIFNWNLKPPSRHGHDQQQPFEDTPTSQQPRAALDNSPPSVTSPRSEPSDHLPGFSNRPASTTYEPPRPPVTQQQQQTLRPTQQDVAAAVTLYFKYCHRQPIWCFDIGEVSDASAVPEELASAILALTARFSDKRDQLAGYGKRVKRLIMLKIANGEVELTTIESLCLLSYSSFIDGNIHLGQFDLGLALQLCRSAMLDVTQIYAVDDALTERKKRLFWSLQILEQSYGRQTGLLSVPTDVWRPTAKTSPGGDQMEIDPNAPPLPRDTLGCSQPSDSGVWNTSVNLGWVWSQVRKYVSDCSRSVMKEPWRHDSMYARVVSDFMETENRVPICHRYDSVKFYERKVDELRQSRDYWAPWLKEQFTYHAITTVLNHPFLYIIGAQHNPNLAIPNTFWRRSSELALLHSTWIVKMIDMVVDKQFPLTDPFFGHVAAIAATVHLYYCCAASQRLRHKSNTDFAKCRRFLKGFLPISAACGALDRNLDKMTRIAAGPENVDVEDWMPSKIYFSVPLMWKILQFNFSSDSPGISTAGLLDKSLTPAIAHEDTSETSLLEIIVATSPEITINTADGGQEAPTFRLSHKGQQQQHGGHTVGSAPLPGEGSRGGPSARGNTAGGEATAFSYDEMSVEQTDDSLTLNTTPWLYADSSQFMNIGGAYQASSSQQSMGEMGGTAWWEGDHFGNLTFSHF